MKRLAIKIIRGYQRVVSPQLGNRCRFEPSCSEYGMQAIEHHGVVRGVPMTAWRIARCNPLSKGGYDPPVPVDRDENSSRGLDQPRVRRTDA